MSQNEDILAYLKEHRTITARDAIEKLGVARLSGRVYDLRKAGHDIFTVRRLVPTRRKAQANIAEYHYRSVE